LWFYKDAAPTALGTAAICRRFESADVCARSKAAIQKAHPDGSENTGAPICNRLCSSEFMRPAGPKPAASRRSGQQDASRPEWRCGKGLPTERERSKNWLENLMKFALPIKFFQAGCAAAAIGFGLPRSYGTWRNKRKEGSL
jgi:hypothetical protein